MVQNPNVWTISLSKCQNKTRSFNPKYLNRSVASKPNFCAKVLLWNPKRLNASVASKPVCLRQSLSSKPKLFKQKFCFAFNQNAWRKVFLWMQLFWTILLLEKTKKVQAQNSWFKTLLLGCKSSFWSQMSEQKSSFQSKLFESSVS